MKLNSIILMSTLVVLLACDSGDDLSKMEIFRMNVYNEMVKRPEIVKFGALFPESHWFMEGIGSSGETAFSLRSYALGRYDVTLVHNIKVYSNNNISIQVDDVELRISEIVQVDAIGNDRFKMIHGRMIRMSLEEWMEIDGIDNFIKSNGLVVDKPAVGFERYKNHMLNRYSGFMVSPMRH
jgi:hypothetical protein